MIHAPPPSRAEREARGKAARTRMPLGEIGQWRAHRNALDIVLAQSALRVSDLVALRHRRMAASPWTYYRGAAAVMPADLATAPNSGLDVQLCGDARVLNFGLWATPERNLSFDLRDFDETLPGPFEWDVMRFVASLVVVARENGLSPDVADDAVASALHTYRSRMRRYANASQMEIWYDSIYVDQLLGYFGEDRRDRASKHIEKKRRRRTSVGAFEKLTETVDGRVRIIEEPPRLTHFDFRAGSRPCGRFTRGRRTPFRTIDATSSPGSRMSTSPVRSSASEASGCASICCSSTGAEATIRCSCR